MQYRKEIDGLRAVAVAPVILFHAGFETFSGGYVGVDVFFVISGYLITSIILHEFQDGRFRLLDFYSRRARRILPALSIIMCACIPLSWWTMVPFQIEDFAQSLLATLGFSSNLLFWIESGYFQPEAELKPLLHTWSLAVEEQYYFVFPLFMLLVFRYGLAALVTLLLAIVIASFLIANFWIERAPAAAFYLLPARAWELLLGALLACYMISRSRSWASPWLRESLSAGGCLLILVAVFLFDDDTPFPGSSALVPTLGAVLIIGFAHGDTVVGRLLASRPLVVLGLLSYSAYLWHQPLLAFYKIQFGLDIAISVRLVLLACTLLLSYLTWRFVEVPFRTAGSMRTSRQFASGLLVASLVAFYAVPAYTSNGFHEAKFEAVPEEYKPFVIDRSLENELRRIVSDDLADEQDMPFTEDGNVSRVLVLGDSLSEDLFTAFVANATLFEQREFRNLRLDDTCYSATTRHLRGSAIGIERESKCALQISTLLQSPLFEQSNEIFIHANPQPSNARDTPELVRALLELGKKVYVVGLLNFNDASSLSMKLHRAKQAPASIFYENLREKYLVVNEILAAALKDMDGAYYLDKFSLFCSHESRRCNVFDEHRMPIFVDGNHMTVTGMSVFGKAMAEAGWLEPN